MNKTISYILYKRIFKKTPCTSGLITWVKLMAFSSFLIFDSQLVSINAACVLASVQVTDDSRSKICS